MSSVLLALLLSTACGGSPPLAEAEAEAETEAEAEAETEAGSETETEAEAEAEEEAEEETEARLTSADIQGVRWGSLAEVKGRLAAVGVAIDCPEEAWHLGDEGYEDVECVPAHAILEDVPILIVVRGVRLTGDLESATGGFDLLAPEGAGGWIEAIYPAIFGDEEPVQIVNRPRTDGGRHYSTSWATVILVPADDGRAARALFRLPPRPRRPQHRPRRR